MSEQLCRPAVFQWCRGECVSKTPIPEHGTETGALGALWSMCSRTCGREPGRQRKCDNLRKSPPAFSRVPDQGVQRAALAALAGQSVSTEAFS